MRFAVLGPVEVWIDGQAAAIGPAMPRAVLSALLLRAGRAVPVDELVDLLWAEEPPRSARKNIQVYVWRLRRSIGSRLELCPGGYRIAVRPEELDLLEFEARLESARAAARRGAPEQAATEYRSALELWRGPALAGLGSIGRFDAAAAGLEHRHLLAHEERIDVELELGRYGAALPLLDELVTRHPLHERFAEQQVIALHRAGHRGEAIEAYLRCRRVLADELGLEPGPVLRRLVELVREPGTAGAGRSVSDLELHELPHTVSTFVGRRGEISRLRSALLPRRSDHAIAVQVISGPAGVGKSTLAIRVAHELAGSFPDGQLYIDLHGATAGLRPLEPLDVLRRLLRVLGAAGTAAPGDAQEASARLRSLTADRRLLMVLDNAHDAGQVRPLIPAGTRCAVLVTSRRSLSDLDGAAHLELGALTDATARELLGRFAGETRIAAEAEAASDLIRWLGGLPLAIRIAGARLAERPNWSLGTLAARLRDERHRLRELRLGDLAVRTSFLVSYEHLREPRAQRLFRLIGAVDVPDLTPEIAAALLGTAPRPAQEALDELVDARLLDETAHDRYRMHDLIRLFARERADAEESEGQREAALARVLTGYLDRTRHALAILRPGTRATATGAPRFTDSGTALSYLESERAGLVATALQAMRSPEPRVARHGVELADSLYLFFEMRGHIEDWIAVDEAAIGAADRIGDGSAQARLLHDLAVAYFYLHRMDDAADHLQNSLRVSRQVGDSEGEARALNQIGILHGAAGEHDRAAEYLNASLRIRERLGDVRSCAATQGNLGTAYRLAGRYEESIRFSRLSARLARRGHAPEIEANALGNLGEVHCLLGRYQTALRYLRRSLAIATRPANERSRGSTMSTLADACLGAGRISEAIEHAEAAVQAFRRADFRHGEALALHRLGRMLCRNGEPDRAADLFRLALAIFTTLGSAEAADVRADLRRADTPSLPASRRVR